MSADWDLSRPHETLRAVCIRYLDGRLPAVRFVVLDDNADPGGTEVLYQEMRADDSDALAAQALAAGVPVTRYRHDPITHEDTVLGWEKPTDG